MIAASPTQYLDILSCFLVPWTILRCKSSLLLLLLYTVSQFKAIKFSLIGTIETMDSGKNWDPWVVDSTQPNQANFWEIQLNGNAQACSELIGILMCHNVSVNVMFCDKVSHCWWHLKMTGDNGWHPTGMQSTILSDQRSHYISGQCTVGEEVEATMATCRLYRSLPA